MVRPITMRSGFDGTNVRRLLNPIQVARHRSLLNFIDELRTPETLNGVGKDDRYFSVLIDVALNEFGLNRQWFAISIPCSLATLGRWGKCEGLPPVHARKRIIETAANLMEQGTDSTILGVPLGVVIRPVCQP
jgi:hypothetical protein